MSCYTILLSTVFFSACAVVLMMTVNQSESLSECLVVDIFFGEVLMRSRVVAVLRTVRYIYVGEQYASLFHYCVQFEVLEAFCSVGADLVIGIEWFFMEVQFVIDVWMSGAIDEWQFFFCSHWKK